ncbi:acetylglutamate kinase [Paenibacillus riograndensis]|uniref:Acetylglutamate kinase n=2 Tax=Paenibacillus riograndensis TaxID=483937 RepID=A0A132U6V5_9BACL|nr:hypothetical protein [Paenibacillus riograndensis]KWX79327.1 acetylglutamate kinase [Paenibacillus riograndensis]
MQYYWQPYSPTQGSPNAMHPSMPVYAEAAPECFSRAQVNLILHMRTLWEQHVAWTRMVIRSIVFDLPDTEVTVARLLQNGPDMGDALKPFYGAAAGDAYGQLIKEHLVIAADLVKAAKAGDQAAAAATEKKWYANGDQIVEFLSRLNPYLPKEDFRKMFYQHLALTKAEAVTLLQKDYKQSVQLYDAIEKGALVMADMISTAIIKQFPQMF